MKEPIKNNDVDKENSTRKPELDKDAKAIVKISKDKLKAFIIYEPALGGNRLSYNDLKDILTEAGVVYGINEDRLKKLLDKDEIVEYAVIAEGKKAVAGKDGELVYHFSTEKKSAGKLREDGSIDFYDLEIINNVEEGEVLVTVIESVPGKAGKTVTGEEILPPKTKEAKLPFGKNVKKKDNKTLIARKAGHVEKNGERVNILPVYTVRGDVDLSTGKIDFVGNVYVGGNVLDGLEIKAGGNIEIRGNVEAANLVSEGNIIIHKGFIGKKKAEIKAEGDIKLKFVENGKITAKRDIYVRDTIMHSRVSSGRKITIKDGKGIIVGGNVRAAKEIEANIIGSSLGTQTVLEAGVSPENRRKLIDLLEQIKLLETNFKKAKQGLEILKQIQEKKGELPYNKKKIYHKLLKTVTKLHDIIPEKKNEYEALNRRISDVKRGRIIANKKVFPGTEIILGDCKRNIRDTLSRTAFVREAGEVIQINL